MDFSTGSDGRICLQFRRLGFSPLVKKIPWRRKWQPNPVFLPGEFHGQRSLEAIIHGTQLSNSHFHFTYFFIEDPLAFHPRLQKELLSSSMLFKNVNLFFHQNINEGCFIGLIFAFTCTLHQCKYLSYYHGHTSTYLLPYYKNLTNQMIPNRILPSTLGTGILWAIIDHFPLPNWIGHLYQNSLYEYHYQIHETIIFVTMESPKWDILYLWQLCLFISIVWFDWTLLSS